MGAHTQSTHRGFALPTAEGLAPFQAAPPKQEREGYARRMLCLASAKKMAAQ